MHPNEGLRKLRFASCSVLLLLLTLALVASSLLVARYAVQASSWWLSLLAVTVCLLGLCTWIQLAASRAGRWRVLLARQIALSRAQASARALHRPAAGLGPGLAPDFYNRGASRSTSAGMGIAHIAVIPLDCELDSQMGYRVPGPPPPPPYALSDLPPSYCVATTDESSTTSTIPPPPPPPAPGPDLEQPPPYAVAIKRDHLVQEATGVAAPAPEDPAAPAPTAPAADNTDRSNNRRTAPVSRRPVLWF
ncbi:Translation initiation factor IF-2 [Frankliniella fusca]|uniref:Translation initiation factor IF-2 n=1 Tax=Frankliniella fusca TaxID=407009 RepID=A0AAE1HEI7_9NEOP|nr:Translation initiation factor IF-2 [Frankliniella fusca]